MASQETTCQALCREGSSLHKTIRDNEGAIRVLQTEVREVRIELDRFRSVLGEVLAVLHALVDDKSRL